MHLNRHALRALRECRGLTATELARLAGTSTSHISNIENGARVPSAALIHSIAAALAVDALAITHHLAEVTA